MDTEVTVTSGASEAIFDAIAAVVRAGDEVIVLDPCYDCYEPAIDLAGARAVHVALDPVTFAPDWDKVRAAISPRTRMLMINSPHNPSGAMLTAKDMRAVAALLRDTGIWLLSDEVYEHIVFDGARHESVLRYPELRERAFVISSFGKTYHCTGWKVGYCIAPAALSTEFRKVHQYNTFCTFAPAQHAFAAMIKAEPEHYEQLGGFYQAKRDRFRQQLLETRLVPLPVPGGYFQLVDYSAVSDLDDVAFCHWLTIEHGVAAIPLSPFYEAAPAGQRLARLCFAKNEATLDAAIERLHALPEVVDA
jgi:methionine aminotransferase